jgi:hypothetical protein
MRQYLKYSNPFSLNEEGKLNKEGSKNNIESIYEKIISIGKIKNNESIRDLITSYNFLKRQSPKSLVAPDGVYLTGDVEKMYDTNYGNDDNENIAATTVLGNPTHYGFDVKDNDGRAGSPDKGKGVRSILRRIGNSKIEASGNFKDIQGKEHENKVFVVGGDKAGDSKKLYQTYTVKNPYAPQMAGKLIFSLTNYSIPATQGRTMYFPPYISSFQNSDSANWNAINFLGRPEAVYTYNYSSRGGSISFFVLTDYAETIVIGREQNETMDVISRNIEKNFTVSDLSSSESTKFLIKEIESMKSNKIKDLQEQKAKAESEYNNNSTEIGKLPKTEGEAKQGEQTLKTIQEKEEKNAELSEKVQSYETLIEKFETSAQNAINSLYATNYSESSPKYKNIYDFYVLVNDDVDGYTETKPKDSAERIDEMIRNLAFQPAYFSGSKVDFKNRMEFLSKLTRPSANNSSRGGFSFTNPPVSHLRLGDWLNHDIIIDSVSYSYDNAPWTINLDGGAVQPMWANVTINFNIVGGAGASGGVPLTSTDKEGFYGVKTIRR